MTTPATPSPARGRDARGARGGPRGVRVEKPLTLLGLERSALWALERRSLTEAQVRTLLGRKAWRAARVHGEEPQAPQWIDQVLQKLVRSGLVDDDRVARGRAQALRDRGASTRKIQMTLKQKGVGQALVAAALATVDDGDPDADLRAARAFVTKKRLRDKDPQKALQALARQGFAYGVARRALDPEPDPDDLDGDSG